VSKSRTDKLVTYVWAPPLGEQQTVTVPVADVMYTPALDGEPLPSSVAALFIAAVKDSYVPFGQLMAEVADLQAEHPHTVRRASARDTSPGAAPAWALQPQPWVHIESWEPTPQPWPVFVVIGVDCVAEFYPEHFQG